VTYGGGHGTINSCPNEQSSPVSPTSGGPVLRLYTGLPSFNGAALVFTCG
jgi:hypothetical protein